MAIAIPLIAWGWYSQYKTEKEYDNYRCKTKSIKVKGVIQRMNPRANYMAVLVDNMDKWISLNIAEVKYKKGFTKHDYYQVGDSLIKEKDTKEFMVKRGANVAVYILTCDD